MVGATPPTDQEGASILAGRSDRVRTEGATGQTQLEGAANLAEKVRPDQLEGKERWLGKERPDQLRRTARSAQQEGTTGPAQLQGASVFGREGAISSPGKERPGRLSWKVRPYLAEKVRLERLNRKERPI